MISVVYERGGWWLSLCVCFACSELLQGWNPNWGRYASDDIQACAGKRKASNWAKQMMLSGDSNTRTLVETPCARRKAAGCTRAVCKKQDGRSFHKDNNNTGKQDFQSNLANVGTHCSQLSTSPTCHWEYRHWRAWGMSWLLFTEVRSGGATNLISGTKNRSGTDPPLKKQLLHGGFETLQFNWLIHLHCSQEKKLGHHDRQAIYCWLVHREWYWCVQVCIGNISHNPIQLLCPYIDDMFGTKDNQYKSECNHVMDLLLKPWVHFDSRWQPIKMLGCSYISGSWLMRCTGMSNACFSANVDDCIRPAGWESIVIPCGERRQHCFTWIATVSGIR